MKFHLPVHVSLISLLICVFGCSGSDSGNQSTGGGAGAVGGSAATHAGGNTSGGATLTTGTSKAAGGASSTTTGGATSKATGGVANAATGGTSANGMGGATLYGVGGTASNSAGGTSSVATGGTSSKATGGTSSKATGGTSSKATGGTSSKATGGATSQATGGTMSGTGGATSNNVTDWLHTSGNQILHSDGTPFHGRGANVFDTRECGSCAWAPPQAGEVIRRIDELVNVWQANFMRFDLVSYASNVEDGITLAQWGDVTQDPNYLADIQNIIGHIGTKPGVYVMVTLYSHPSQDANELPTAATMPVLQKLSDTFKDAPYVLYGVTNEPHDTTDEDVWTAMNSAVDAIRSMEPAAGPNHLIAVQGTQGYSRELAYYVTNPITAGGGVNIIYETHVYNPPSDWQSMFIDPANTLPVIIGEFGPADGYMTLDQCNTLMAQAEQLEIPYTGWSFSPECSPDMLQPVDNTTDCGTGMALTPSDWGTAIINRLAVPW